MDPVTSPWSSCWFSVINYVHPFGSSGNPCFHSQLKKRVCDNILKPWFSCLLFKTIYILWALSESLTVTLKILDLCSLLKPVVLFSGNLNLTLRAPGFISLLESVLFLLRHTLCISNQKTWSYRDGTNYWRVRKRDRWANLCLLVYLEEGSHLVVWAGLPLLGSDDLPV